MTALLGWLYSNVLGNLVASAIWATPATVVWFRKIKPHLHHEHAHREHVARQLAELHDRIDRREQP